MGGFYPQADDRPDRRAVRVGLEAGLHGQPHGASELLFYPEETDRYRLGVPDDVDPIVEVAFWRSLCIRVTTY